MNALDDTSNDPVLVKRDSSIFPVIAQWGIRKTTAKVQPGDMIAFNRGLYDHYAIYVGQRRVIHRYNEEDTDFGELAKTACKNLSLTSNKAHIMESNYDDVLKGGTAEIHNSEDFHLPHFTPEEIVFRARNCLESEEYYNILTGNCEHFAHEMRYGVEGGYCSQVGETIYKNTGLAAFGAMTVGGFAISALSGSVPSGVYTIGGATIASVAGAGGLLVFLASALPLTACFIIGGVMLKKRHSRKKRQPPQLQRDANLN